MLIVMCRNWRKKSCHFICELMLQWRHLKGEVKSWTIRVETKFICSWSESESYFLLL